MILLFRQPNLTRASSGRWTSSLESLSTASGSVASSVSVRLPDDDDGTTTLGYGGDDEETIDDDSCAPVPAINGGLFDLDVAAVPTSKVYDDRTAGNETKVVSAALGKMTVDQLRERIVFLEQKCALVRMPMEMAEKEICRLQSTVVSTVLLHARFLVSCQRDGSRKFKSQGLIDCIIYYSIFNHLKFSLYYKTIWCIIIFLIICIVACIIKL
jgi:hypothetical protein